MRVIFCHTQEDDIIYTAKKHKKLWVFPWIFLLLLSALAGCAGNPGKDNDNSGAEIIEDDQLYMLLNCNSDTGRLFLESVETGKQETFDYDEKTNAVNRNGETAAVDSLPVGELVEIAYTKEKLVTRLAVSEDTFEYRNIPKLSIDQEAESITVAGNRYSYDEYLKVFSNKGVIPLSVLMEPVDGDSVSIRGRGTEVLTVVLDRVELEEK